MRKEEIEYIIQIVKTLEEVIPRLETAYNKKDAETFNRIKKFILQAQRKVQEVVK
jgi:exonuclease VII small subunit